MRLLKKTDWSQADFTSTNGALNLRSSLIEKVVIKGEFYDPRERLNETSIRIGTERARKS